LNAEFLRGGDRAHMCESLGAAAFKYPEYLQGQILCISLTWEPLIRVYDGIASLSYVLRW
jgi:hypothetical protein